MATINLSIGCCVLSTMLSPVPSSGFSFRFRSVLRNRPKHFRFGRGTSFYQDGICNNKTTGRDAGTAIDEFNLSASEDRTSAKKKE
ncbi:Hypothetical protein CINCED_3A007501 [Cinara cedri]|uniref:Uncharacterized protein n=1 Tax=Cinara cedri TaxID=506608 RepID=A0A5E4M2J5_9HEMI|nr:Hypothetical protein CINCED_3A007501 [Cinara cedri]